jgi:hypothetical protein
VLESEEFGSCKVDHDCVFGEVKNKRTCLTIGSCSGKNSSATCGRL